MRALLKRSAIPSPVARRLSLYLRQLESLATSGVEIVTSRSLADALRVTGAQVRKDLSYVGRCGQPSIGYRVEPLIAELRRVLHLDRARKVVLIGVGNLGRAVLLHRRFRWKGFLIVAAFDVSKAIVGRKVGGVRVRDVSELRDFVADCGAKLAVVAVPSEAGQAVAECLCQAGIQGILNFVPTVLNTPRNVTVRSVDLAAELEQLSLRVGEEPAGWVI